ncbi:hypothetical protein EVAR_23533_1 [Eumeta japonica]|uniref:Uncharacterized protein n=1 Tax=Eumeta variegata TaxID=151549 RepID=A0A4C1W4Q3_EUMVA|nr:hypothetical protein EVAR_23533_1 [Eumeta japonica]
MTIDKYEYIKGDDTRQEMSFMFVHNKIDQEFSTYANKINRLVVLMFYEYVKLPVPDVNVGDDSCWRPRLGLEGVRFKLLDIK